jgi:hypothetical protein
MRGGILCIAAAAVLFLLAACGGSGGGTTTTSPPLTVAAYAAKIAKVKTEAGKAQAQVQLGLQAKTVSELKQRVDAFAEATQRIGDEVAALNPPANAAVANAELATGLHDIAAGTRAASAKLATLKTVQAAIAYLRNAKGPVKGGREVASALVKLQKLGYTTGR